MRAKKHLLTQHGKVMSGLLMALFIVLSSCIKDDDVTILDTYIDLSFKDADGNDLLSGSTDNAYKQDSIKLYYLINGKQERAYINNIEAPEGFYIYRYQQGVKNIMRLFPSEHDEGQKTTTYIKFNEAETDVIVCELIRWGSPNKTIAVTKVWYNDELVWNGEWPRYIEIVK